MEDDNQLCPGECTSRAEYDAVLKVVFGLPPELYGEVLANLVTELRKEIEEGKARLRRRQKLLEILVRNLLCEELPGRPREHEGPVE